MHARLRALQRDPNALPCMESLLRCTHAVLVLHARAPERIP